jgi:hypothetical protein
MRPHPTILRHDLVPNPSQNNVVSVVEVDFCLQKNLQVSTTQSQRWVSICGQDLHLIIFALCTDMSIDQYRLRSNRMRRRWVTRGIAGRGGFIR